MRNANNILNTVLGSPLISAAAAGTHDGWRAGKAAAKADPNNPYLGYGPARKRVRDFTEDELDALGIPAAARTDPTADVYHHWDLPFDELPPEVQTQNIVPMLALCLTLGDALLPAAATEEDLEHRLEALISDGGSDGGSARLVNANNHLAYLGAQVAFGRVGYGDNAHPDFQVYSTLRPDVQALDGYTTKPAAEWLLNYVRTSRAAGAATS